MGGLTTWMKYHLVSNQQTWWCLTSRIVLWWIWNLTNFQVRRQKIATLIWHTFWMPATQSTQPGCRNQRNDLGCLVILSPERQGIGSKYYQVDQSRLRINSKGSSWTSISPLQNTWRGRKGFPASSNMKEKFFMMHGRGSNYCCIGVLVTSCQKWISWKPSLQD